MKIYTKTGDKGTTSLFAGGRVAKNHQRVEAYGTVDELNAALGLARAHHASAQTDTWLITVQNQLFHLGADLATPLDAQANWIQRLDGEAITWLENTIDRMNDDLPELKSFILPGGSLAAAQIHVARTICRRAERQVVALQEQVSLGDHVLVYLNRLSDFLFVLARWENFQTGESETTWTAR